MLNGLLSFASSIALLLLVIFIFELHTLFVIAQDTTEPNTSTPPNNPETTEFMTNSVTSMPASSMNMFTSVNADIMTTIVANTSNTTSVTNAATTNTITVTTTKSDAHSFTYNLFIIVSVTSLSALANLLFLA